MFNFNRKRAKLILEDGSEFIGYSFGYEKLVSGEIVFNTGMVGYPETLTDPSYKGQILVLTYPLIGNYGVPFKKREDGVLKYFESDRIHLTGLIVSDYSEMYHHWASEKSLSQWLTEEKIPAISGIDTRALAIKLREKGVMLAKIVFDDQYIDFYDPDKDNLVKEVSIKEPIVYKKGKKKVVLIDCGTKNNIIRELLKRDITVIRVPWNWEFYKEQADGYLISNGPGNPIRAVETIENTRKLLELNKPTFGICFGSQIMALATGAKTYKMKYGHRGHNQPCRESGTIRNFITSQNHGYAINSSSLGEDWRIWFYNLNDNTNEGIIHVSKPFFATQFHPEASPGPDDTTFVFDMFGRAL